MHLLAFDTSTEHLSIAVKGDGRVFTHAGAGGAQASHTLIPAILALLREAGTALDDLDAIVFGQGPGSFTGLRTACAVAQGLAFGARGGAGLPVLPVPTLLAVAEEARAAQGCMQVLATLDARMDEVYTAACIWNAARQRWALAGEVQLLAPEAVQVPAGWTLAGNAAAVYGARLAPEATRVAALPTAAALLRLAPALLAAGAAVAADAALPLYVRDKVAQTTAERAALKGQAA
ncbi:tRNA (adenosine(37)-N6)-threonylcarbamoyltransferase complex dimerization subunit type 1 TsaB [Comamonas badia]|uniref:tRNA (adenosine(37)-N6)-threonylcarbamoyltransferase complex dimerization subunit type 1 TsaB n=1 Tax=Comamonas badia TaxID=265291 RepID=UPI0004059AF6|nr:tRNA (adenosine(37)-N6)-threonylcarbamoyltransferase complex dimerization subunit type 1 TsaB [Comamonas badia]